VLSLPHSATVAAVVADPARLAAVRSYGLSGHAGDPDLDAAVIHLARVLRVPMAVINLVGPNLQCYPAEYGVGAPTSHVPDELSFCAYVVAQGAPLAVADARTHPVFSANPLVQAGSIASFLGLPLIDEDGFVLGTVSVFDGSPREFTDEDRTNLQTILGLVRAVLSLRRRVAAHEWDARLLATQNRVLEAVASGAPLLDTLEFLDAAALELSQADDPQRRRTLRDSVKRLTVFATDATERRQTMERLAQRDPLTGLANRAHFTRAGTAALANGGAVLFIDLDRFKEVNDRGGHAAGDHLLTRLAHRLRDRVENATPGAVVGRLGGDEFAVVLPRVDQETAAGIGEELLDCLVEEVVVGRRTVRVSSSIGLAMARPGAAFDDVLRAADDAMYTAKSSGRARLSTLHVGSSAAPPDHRDSRPTCEPTRSGDLR
jgi:diguanylate cyclase (GGDEF)-like protein